MRLLDRAIYRAKHRVGKAIVRVEPDKRRSTEFFSKFVAASEADSRFAPRADEMYFIDSERTSTTTFDRHYLYHTAWAARVLLETRPEVHTDVASLVDFNALISAFVPVRHYDYRPPDIELPNLTVGRADLTELPFEDESVSSLSCMHVVEHVGLGRYGEPLDPTADIIAMKELARVLAPGGELLFVVPVGRARVVFNAHRVYSFRMIADAFPDLELIEFVLVPDSAQDGHLVYGASEDMVDAQEFGCGCFRFRRPVERDD